MFSVVDNNSLRTTSDLESSGLPVHGAVLRRYISRGVVNTFRIRCRVTVSALIGLTAVVTLVVYIPALPRGYGQLTAVHPVKQLLQGWSLAGLFLVM